MSKIDDIREEASVARKWAAEKSDWLDNPAVRKRYQEDPHTLARRADEARVMFRASQRLDEAAAALESREKAA